MYIKYILIAFGFNLLFHVSNINADDLPTGREIMENVHAQPEGETITRSFQMILKNAKGNIRERTVQSFKKIQPDINKTVFFFSEPKNIRGSGFLTWDYKTGKQEDAQWIYLPATRKSRRISASKRGDYFFGSDLTYDDMKTEGKAELDEYNYQTIGVEKIAEHESYSVEAVPVNSKISKELGYSKAQLWVDKQIWEIRKIKLWDRKDRELKTIEYPRVENIDGFWTIIELKAVNHQTGHETQFNFSGIKYNALLKKNIFKENSLKRGI